MFRRIINESISNNNETRQINQNSTRFKIACKISELKRKEGTLNFSKKD